MKNVLALLLVGLVGFSVLGFIPMNHDMNHSNTGCVPFAVGGALCPLGLVDMTFHHIAAFQEFSNFLLPLSGATSSILYAFFWLVVLSLIIKNLSPGYFNQQNHLQKLYLRQNNVFDIYSTKITRYLALLENSPSFSKGI
ncbi:MAG: hypothetical protein UT37_C0011G0009 [Parcubacteria group bacterium GW2011_GWA2_39_18]|nr:MAG: hypothetical protein UT37_C0011G0009 [Parcubacteria group bacterium GW2011_GWA2_39_18]